MESTKENSKQSSMRISLYWVVGMAVAFTASICVTILIQAANSQPVDWNGVGWGIGAIGVFIAPAFGFKVWQKQYENKE
jgi:uncharacterized BrkB/YihY/UPF0761 family membrane protein